MTVLQTLADVSYGPHERNVSMSQSSYRRRTNAGFRLAAQRRVLLRRQDTADPEVGGSSSGPRHFGRSAQLQVSRPAIFPAPNHECFPALQFARRSADSGLDASWVAVGGLSAGAGMALWLGCSTEMADPADPVKRESTKNRNYRLFGRSLGG